MLHILGKNPEKASVAWINERWKICRLRVCVFIYLYFYFLFEYDTLGFSGKKKKFQKKTSVALVIYGKCTFIARDVQ